MRGSRRSRRTERWIQRAIDVDGVTHDDGSIGRRRIMAPHPHRVIARIDRHDLGIPIEVEIPHGRESTGHSCIYKLRSVRMNGELRPDQVELPIIVQIRGNPRMRRKGNLGFACGSIKNPSLHDNLWGAIAVHVRDSWNPTSQPACVSP